MRVMPPPHKRSAHAFTRRAALCTLGALPAAFACAPPTPLRVGTNVWPGYEPLYVLREDAALPSNVQLLELVSASQVMRGLRSGLIDVGALTLDEAIRLQAQLGDVVLLAVLDVSDGGDALVGGPNVAQLEALRGRTVACEESALGLYMLARALEKGQVPPAEVATVHFPVNEHGAAYARGDADAFVTFEPVLGELVSRGAKVLFTSSDIPGEVVDVLVTRQGTWAARGAELQQLCDTWFLARERVVDSVERGAAHATLRLGRDDNARRSVYNGIHFPTRTESDAMLRADTGTLPPVAARIRDVLTQLGLARADTPVDRMFRGPRGGTPT